MKKKYLLIIIISILLCIITIIITQKNYIINKINSRYISKEQNQDILFEVYSNSDNKLKFKITAIDEEQGINKFVYNLENGKEVQINAYNKESVSIDYVVENNGEYTFKFINGKGQQFQKTITINDEYRNNLIDIQVSTEKEIDTYGNVKIDYYGNENKTRTYKIGENGQWTKYSGEFAIDAYEILKNNLQDNTTKTVKIYAKIEDDAKNVILINKEIKNIDVDIADEPEIIYTGSDRISVLGKYGVYLDQDVDVTINFDKRTDITNYYSLNNGVTWNEYTGIIQTKETHIIAKSIKNESGLEISKKQNCNNVLSNNIIPVEAYDEDNDTAIRIINKSIRIDDGLEGYSVKLLLNCPAWNHVYIKFYLEYNETATGNTGYWHTSYGKDYLNLTIPENAKWIKIVMTNEGHSYICDIYEINIETTPVGSIEDMYPHMTSSKIENKEKYKIQYFETAVEKLYSYDNITWTDYPEEGISLEYGQTVYAKSIDKNKRDSIVLIYKNELTDILDKEAYDNDESTKAIAYDKVLYVDSDIWNKEINVKFVADLYSRVNIRFLNESNEIISEYSDANGTFDKTYTIPENTKKITWKYTDGNRAKSYIYEIKLL